MNKWELARYLIDAKKAVDSVWFIALHGKELRNIDIRKEIENNKSIFYINICTVLDEFIGRKKRKKELCESDVVIKAIYYKRDKHYAHKDYDYNPKTYDSLLEIYEDMKSQLTHIRKICTDSLPNEVTLDFVPHDKQLFRHLHGVTPEKEEEIKKIKQLGYGQPISKDVKTEKFQIFQDSEDAKFLTSEERNRYATLFECGICEYESLQNFQDASIKTNVLFEENMWCNFNLKQANKIKKLKEMGYLDVYDIPHIPNSSDPIAWSLFLRDIKKAGVFDDKT